MNIYRCLFKKCFDKKNNINKNISSFRILFELIYIYINQCFLNVKI